MPKMDVHSYYNNQKENAISVYKHTQNDPHGGQKVPGELRALTVTVYMGNVIRIHMRSVMYSIKN